MPQTIVLVNLLIAMFSDTYTSIQSAAETEYRLQKAARTYLYRNVVLAVPPPLNFPYVFYHTVFLDNVEEDMESHSPPPTPGGGGVRTQGLSPWTSAVL